MGKRTSYKILVGLLLFLLLVGLANYILFQPDILLLYFFHIETVPQQAPLLLTGYFSDIIWCAALCIALAVLEQRQVIGRTGKIIALALPFATEVAQRFHLLNGTFDWYDVLSYVLVIALFTWLFPSIACMNVKRLQPRFWYLPVIAGFLLTAIASTAPKHTYQPPKPEPCITHLGLSYSPVLVKINLSGSYTMKDLAGAQRMGYEYIMDRLDALSPYKYKLADGVTPNLTLDITINTDSYQHYGATLNSYVYDGSFYNTWSNDYVTPEKLFDDIAAKVDVYIRYGWCKNCPSPCMPK